jgi:hypothetical protein
MKSIVSLVLVLLCVNASAYSIFTLKPVNWSKVKSVDVFVAGYGKEMGLQFLFGAIARAEKHDEMYDDSRAQLIMWAEEWNKRKDKKVLTDRGFTIIEVNSRHLTNEKIFNQLKRLPAIRSLHIVSHNAAFGGSAIQAATDRMGVSNFPWKELRSKFTPDSYVFLHGCNTGFLVAPGISKGLQRPVFGSMTSTDFQEIFADGDWYHNNAQFDQFPTGMRRLKTSGDLFARTQSCWKGYCHRMMPNIHPYRGHWGRYQLGLPYYQAFCNYGSAEAASSCKKGVASAISTSLTLNPRSWEDKVIDFMCPRMADPEIFQNCIDVLKGTSEKRVFWGKNVRCSRKKCDVKTEAGRNNDGDRIQNFVGDDAGLSQMRKDYAFFMSLEQYQ